MTGLPGGADPFSALGLPAQADLTDDDVRSAWRRIAAATHPDRADGGDPGRFALAAAAYTMLRTRSGRGEALADLASPSPRAGRAGAAWTSSGRARTAHGLPRRPPRPAAAPTGPGLSRPGLARPGPAEPGPAEPATAGPGLAEPGPAGPEAAGPGPAEPATARPGPAEPGLAEPGPDVVTGTGRLRLLPRIRQGRPARLTLRVLIAAAVSTVAAAVAGSQPATPALITGALTWLLLTARHDLAPPF